MPPPPPMMYGGGPPPPPYGSPQFGAVNQPAGTPGMAIASLVLGLVSLLCCQFVIPAVLAIVFGVIAQREYKSNPYRSGRNMAIAGIVLGAVSLALFVLSVGLRVT